MNNAKQTTKPGYTTGRIEARQMGPDPHPDDVWYIVHVTGERTPDFGDGEVLGQTEPGMGSEADAKLWAAAPELSRVLLFQASWRMRDGTPCACPVGKDEDEPRGPMPTKHATHCEMLRAALTKAVGA